MIRLWLILISSLCYLFTVTSVFADGLNQTDGALPNEEYAPPAEGTETLPAHEYFGYKDGFFIHDPESNFLLRINSFTQLRFLYSEAHNLDNYEKFQLRRMALLFSGHLPDESWTYVLGALTSGEAGSFTPINTFVVKTFDKNTWLQIGLFNTPFLHETILLTPKQLAVERSLVAKYFSTNSSIGTIFGKENEHFKLQLSATNGDFVYNKQLTETGNDADNEVIFNGLSYAFLSRFEFKPFGKWQEFTDYTTPAGTSKGLLIGIAAAYQKDNNRLATEELMGTADITFQGSGWNVSSMVAVLQDQIRNYSSYGAWVQGGLFVDELRKTLELYSRYEWGRSGQYDSILNLDEEDLRLLTTGFNYYILPKLKFTSEFGYAFTNMGGNWADPVDGWRITDETGQWMSRSQLQLVF